VAKQGTEVTFYSVLVDYFERTEKFCGIEL